MFAGFEIPVDDALLVGRLERLGDLTRDRQRLLQGNRPLLQALGERRTLDQLQYERRRVRSVLETVDRGDVGMVEGSEDLRFACEAREPVRIEPRQRRENLERDVAVQLGVPRAIDLAHPAGAEQRDDLVVAKPGSSREGHTASIVGRRATARDGARRRRGVTGPATDTAHTGRHRGGRAEQGPRTGVMLICNDPLSTP